LISTVLVEGSVEIGHPGSNKLLMKAGELVEYSKDDHQMVRYVIDPEKYIAWKSGKLMFRDDPMEAVILQLERWYNVEIKVVDKKILQYAYTATFENETLEQVLHFLELSAPIRYSVDERERRPDGTFGRQMIKLYKK
jgi:ferric-dicitrate binding protein FerR (iron transport regulator)